MAQAGHAASAADRRTPAATPRAARVAAAPTDDVRHVAASSPCSLQLAQEGRGGGVEVLIYFVRRARPTPLSACDPAVPGLLIAARGLRHPQVVAVFVALRALGRF